LAGFGITAFGIAPLAPDAAALPQHLIVETLPPLDLEPQFEALSQHELELVRNDLTRSGDTADSLLHRLGVDDPQAAAFIRSNPTARRLLEGQAGKMVRVETDSGGSLRELVARYPADSSQQFATHFSRLSIARRDTGWQSTVETAPLSTSVRLASGTIRSSLFAATDESSIPEGVAGQIAEIFSADIDFRHELRRGDTFSLVYEALTADGEPITWNQAAGRVLAAEFMNNGRSHAAVWFIGPDGKGGYYDFNGRSKRRSFLASPVAFSRITSGFAMRMHPILQTWRQHLGTDYAAPTGTPVRSIGDGTVEFAGWQNGYGNVVKVQHGNDRQTTYAHLSRIDVRVGQRVSQGESIGAVGATGWATGPHLHFEFRVKGVHQDPQRIARMAETVALDAASEKRFAVLLPSVKAGLEAARSIEGAQGE
jgi:murein DD-endopeptidase MepM/ murein hydrolase activator NlpD